MVGEVIYSPDRALNAYMYVCVCIYIQMSYSRKAFMFVLSYSSLELYFIHLF